MNVSVCGRCGEPWSVLHDGTLVEHPQQDNPALLCPGSRTKAEVGREPISGPRLHHGRSRGHAGRGTLVEN